MIMVVVGHTQFVALGRPTISSFCQAPLDLSVRCLIQFICLPCVNIFILISGYFGIHPKLKGFLNLVFQVIFFSAICYAILIISGHARVTIKGIAEIFGLTSAFWFFKSYLLLYLLSPVLNSFSDNASKKQFTIVLVSFFAFQTIFGWYLHTAHFFCTGMSTISFIGLYLLGRFISIYRPHFSQYNRFCYLALFFLLVMSLLLVTMVLPHFLSVTQEKLYANLVLPLGYYSSPIVIVQVVSLFLFFSSLNFSSKRINRVASCCFAIYLLHQRSDFIPIWTSFLNNLHNTHSLFSFYSILIGIIILYLLSCYIIDSFRLLLWKRVSRNIA